jgi:hypothetical protein
MIESHSAVHGRAKPMSVVSPSRKQTVAAPPPSPPSARTLPNQVFSVCLNADEDVEWLWTHSMDGTSYVSGYRITRKRQVPAL